MAEDKPHGPVSEHFMRHYYGASGVTQWPPSEHIDWLARAEKAEQAQASLLAALEQLPTTLTWRIAETFQDYEIRSGFDADDRWVKWSDVRAILEAARPVTPEQD